jgi:hypothetical protein
LFYNIAGLCLKMSDKSAMIGLYSYSCLPDIHS